MLRHLTATLGAGRAAGPGGPGEAEVSRLLVGLASPDDAAVYKLSEEQAVVLTVDFFPPIVDDPYAYGAIAAANAMSDVYAMGGEVLLALNVAAFPQDLPLEIVQEVFVGAATKVAEGGGIIAGGHTVYDPEPKFGLCVMGLLHPQEVITKAAARPGDALYLTKPVGTGIIVNAHKAKKVHPEHMAAAIESMLRLNRHPVHLTRRAGVHALTDITGFGLLGHAYEMAEASGVAMEIEAARVPLLPGALEYAAEKIATAGGRRNEEYLRGRVSLPEGLPPERRAILHDPQTSGGLLIALPQERAPELEASFAAEGLSLWAIGRVVAGSGIVVT